MKICGLTGNIGSGKTTVGQIFSALEIPVFQADKEARAVLGDPEVTGKVSAIFGNDLITESGSIDRSALAAKVFSDPGRLAILNGILHPVVMDRFRHWVSGQEAPYVIMEAAIIYESGIEDEFDFIIHVSCPSETAIRRVMSRDQATRGQVLLRMQHQLQDETKAGLADFVIVNDDLHALLPQVIDTDRKIRSSCSR